MYFSFIQMEEDMAGQVVDIIDKTGYVTVKSSTRLLKNSLKSGWNVNDKDIEENLSRITSSDGWFQPFKIKTIAKEKVAYQNPQELVQIIIAAALKVKKKDVDVLPTSNEVTKSSVASEFLLKLRGKNFLRISFDTVPLIKLSWNPVFVEEWRNRKRKWPTETAIDELLAQGGYLIAKPSVSEKYNEETTEMRYAFAHIERQLVQMRSKHQNFVYMIFKIMLTKWVKPIEKDQLSSFIGKTVMFWTCEEYPPEMELWDPGYDSLIIVLRRLFSKLSEAFRDGYLPYFFNEKVNVIESVSSGNRAKVIQRIDEILNDIGTYLPLEYTQEYKAGLEILNAIKSTTDVLEEIKRKNFKRLLRQPELIIDALEIFLDDLDWEELSKKVGKELRRFGKKVENELKRFGKRAEDEIKRSGKKVEKELKRFAKRIGL